MQRDHVLSEPLAIVVRWRLRDGRHLSVVDRLAAAVGKIAVGGEIRVLLAVDASETSAKRLLPQPLWPHILTGETALLLLNSGRGTDVAVDDPEVLVRILEARAGFKPSVQEQSSAEDYSSWPTSAQVKSLPGQRPLSSSRIVREGLEPGTPAPGFLLPACDGSGQLGPANFLGRDLILIFTDPLCGPCNSLLLALANHLRAHPLVDRLAVLLVGRGDPKVNALHMDRFGLRLPAVVQRRWELSRDYGIFANPVAFHIGATGVIATPVARGGVGVLQLINDVSNSWEVIE
jgi:hypothetical protein